MCVWYNQIKGVDWKVPSAVVSLPSPLRNYAKLRQTLKA